MNNFIRKTLLFILFPVFFILIVLLSFNHLVKTNYKIKPDISTIFIGDSHIQLAINDSLIPECVNVATSSESFYFSYYKLKILLEENPSIKHVYLGLGFHSLSNYYDRFICGDYSFSTGPKYYFTLPPIEQIRLIYWNKTNLVPFFKRVIWNGIKQTFNKKYEPVDGGYSRQFNETVAVESSMDKRLQFQYYNNVELNSFSELNIHYLNEIVSRCKKANVDFTVLNTPLHEYYYKKIPKEYKDRLNEIVRTNKLSYIDLSNLQLSDSCFIPDGDHVSSLGAEKTSIKIKEIIQERTTSGFLNKFIF